MFKKIPGFKNMMVNENGIVYNSKTGNILKPSIGTNGYLQFKTTEDGVIKRTSIHRAVALCFCKGYRKGKVVDHIDGNKMNNNYKNLRWVSQKDNINYGYERRQDTSFRNFKIVDLYYCGKYVSSFWSKVEACKYSKEKYGCKFSMIQKWNKHNNCEIKESVTTIP